MIGQPIRTLDPAQSIDTASAKIVSQLYDGLTYYPKGTPTPELLLAEDLSVSDDGREYAFALKPNATFSDGSPVRAADVVYTFERLASSPVSAWASTLLDLVGVTHETRTVETDSGTREEYVPGSLGVEAADERTVRLRLSEPFHATTAVLAHPSFGIVPEGIVGDVEGYDGEVKREEFAARRPVGAGPFALDYWKQGTEYRVNAREDYHGHAPTVAGIHWQVISDPNSAYEYATNGNADAFWVPDARFDPELVSIRAVDERGRKVGTYGPLPENGKTVRYVQVPQATTMYVGFNAELVPRPVRRAVAYALNQERQLRDVHKGRGLAATHLTPPSLFPGGPEAYDRHARGHYPYGVGETRLDAAERTLREAGYDPGDPAELTFTVYEGANWRTTGERLRDQLAAVGVELTLEEAPFPALAKRRENGALEMFSFGWSMDYPAPENFLQLLSPTAEASRVAWKGTDASKRAAEAWKAIEAHRTESDADRTARRRACLAMERANWEDAVIVPKYHPVGEGFYYRWVDVPKTGAAGFDKHKYNHVRIARRT